MVISAYLNSFRSGGSGLKSCDGLFLLLLPFYLLHPHRTRHIVASHRAYPHALVYLGAASTRARARWAWLDTGDGYRASHSRRVHTHKLKQNKRKCRVADKGSARVMTVTSRPGSPTLYIAQLGSFCISPPCRPPNVVQRLTSGSCCCHTLCPTLHASGSQSESGGLL